MTASCTSAVTTATSAVSQPVPAIRAPSTIEPAATPPTTPPRCPPDARRTAQTMSFMTIALAQLFHAWNSRKERAPIASLRDAAANAHLLGAAALTIGMQMAAVYLRPLGRVLDTTQLSAPDLSATAAFSLIPVAVGQTIRLLRTRSERKQDARR